MIRDDLAPTAPPFRRSVDPEPLLRRALTHGGAHADVFAESRRSHAVRIEGGALEAVAQSSDRGIALRLLTAAGASRLATSTDLDPRVLAALADEVALADAPEAAPPKFVLSDPACFQTAVRVSPHDVSTEHRIELAQRAERIARAVSSEVVEVGVYLSDDERWTVVAGSDGRLTSFVHTRTRLGVEVVARRGALLQTAYEACGGAGGFEQLPEERVEHTAKLAAERALKMLSAKPAPAGTMPVVLAAEAGGTFVHEAVGHALEADAVLEGTSVFGDRFGETIAAPNITVIDDSTLPGANGSFVVDDEGVEGQRTVLVQRGVLVGWLHDRRTAHLMGTRSSGKGRRESFRSRPIVRMSNTIISSGSDDPGAILRDTPSGLYVVRMGGGEVDTLSGQFVFEVNEAYEIVGGALGAPVRGATLIGDAAEVLLSIDRVGHDLGFGIGVCGKNGQDVPVADGEPTIRVPQLVVGGE